MCRRFLHRAGGRCSASELVFEKCHSRSSRHQNSLMPEVRPWSRTRWSGPSCSILSWWGTSVVVATHDAHHRQMSLSISSRSWNIRHTCTCLDNGPRSESAPLSGAREGPKSVVSEGTYRPGCRNELPLSTTLSMVGTTVDLRCSSLEQFRDGAVSHRPIPAFRSTTTRCCSTGSHGLPPPFLLERQCHVRRWQARTT